ncbi:SDR family oxidoreductase [Granulicella sp. dw_53]|uniref:SDR family oxidoreductase n=1 Tax=Granulicella sp. dw_53 TaxID=2719792 RepID=UPI001BD1C4D5|nr:SDR family oxidoreductase [Granulicella sp. dw_53]
MGKLNGSVAVVTGGTAGIGLATAKRFAEEGATVFLTGRRQAELDAAVKLVGHGATGVQGDVAKLEDLDKLYAVVKEKAGRVDVLFAAAASGGFVALETITEEDYDSTFGTNVKGLIFTVQKALPLFTDGGSIILSSSVVGSKGIPSWSVYSATKAAVRSFARTWTTDLKERKIRVNAISAGPTDTPGLTALSRDAEHDKQLKAYMVGMIPLGRLGSADEIAKAAVFLASSDSSFIAGTELFVDGGVAAV